MNNLLFSISLPLCRKLSLEVDQLLHDIEPQLRREGGPQEEMAAKMSISSDGGSAKEVSILTEMGFEDNDAIDPQQNTEGEYKKKQQVTNELDTLLGQIQQLHNGFIGLKEGGTKVSHNVINTDSTVHNRTGSLDLMATARTNTPPPSSTNGLTSLAGHHSNRLSVVW